MSSGEEITVTKEFVEGWIAKAFQEGWEQSRRWPNHKRPTISVAWAQSPEVSHPLPILGIDHP